MKLARIHAGPAKTRIQARRFVRKMAPRTPRRPSELHIDLAFSVYSVFSVVQSFALII
jgi:hypothetical protein